MNTDKKTAELTEEQKAKIALAEAMTLIGTKGKEACKESINKAGALLAQLDSIHATITADVIKLGEDKAVWELELVPVTVKLSDGNHKWVEVNGLDRNARIQIVDNGAGACHVHISAKSSKKLEQTAYFETLVGATSEFTGLVVARKAIKGKTFNQIFAIAKTQEQERAQKKFANIAPPVFEKVVKATLIKKADIA